MNSPSPYIEAYPRHPPSSRPGDDRARHLHLADYRYDNDGYNGSQNLTSGPTPAAYSNYPPVYHPSSYPNPRGAPESHYRYDERYSYPDQGRVAGEEYHREGSVVVNEHRQVPAPSQYYVTPSVLDKDDESFIDKVSSVTKRAVSSLFTSGNKDGSKGYKQEGGTGAGELYYPDGEEQYRERVGLIGADDYQRRTSTPRSRYAQLVHPQRNDASSSYDLQGRLHARQLANPSHPSERSMVEMAHQSAAELQVPSMEEEGKVAKLRDAKLRHMLNKVRMLMSKNKRTLFWMAVTLFVIVVVYSSGVLSRNWTVGNELHPSQKISKVRENDAQVDCGSHFASSCADCPHGNGEPWCNGDCVWVPDDAAPSSDSSSSSSDLSWLKGECKSK